MSDETESMDDQGGELEAKDWEREERAKAAAKKKADLTPAKGFASIAQAIRCDGLVAAGTITKEVFERDLLATDLDAIPWRKGPAKEGDGDPEALAGLVARRSALQAVELMKSKSGLELDAIANDDNHPLQDEAQQEIYQRSLSKD